ncbi:MAG TPA: glycine oxidase ThiO [Chloroflexota bacterium]|nr:glycine oxidase ThiO [Chloroflexota bacterium]
MSGFGSAPDVAVVGGGVIGCAVAYYAARAGARVVLLERNALGAEASGAAAGMLAPLAEDAQPGPFLDFAVASLGRYAALAEALRAESGIDIELQTAGLLRLALDDAEADHYRAGLGWQAELGLAVRWLDAAEARAREPLLPPGVRGAVYSESEHQVNPTRLVEALARAAAARGAGLRVGAPVRGLLRQGEQVVGVRLADEDVPAGHVVVATGAWAAASGDWLGVPLPVAPVKGQMVAVRPLGPLPRYTLYGRRGYLVPKADGTVHVGATVEQAAFDRRVTAAGVSTLLGLLPALAPSLAEGTFVRAWAGLRPGTPDHRPLLGPVPGLRGVSLATGHYRNGILLAPITGEVVAQAALGLPTSLPLEPFAVARFASAPAAAR